MINEQAAEERHAEADGYRLTYYPGFCSRASVRSADGKQHELFAQTETYHLPKGEKLPSTRHKLALSGGSNGQDVTLEIDDPHHRIARIRIELYEKDARDDVSRDDDEPTEEFEVKNLPRTCPPFCSE